MNNAFLSSQDFLGHFDFKPIPQYFSTTILTDGRIGFTVYREYPKGSAYVTSTSNGNRNDVAAISLIYDSSKTKPFDPRKVNIFISVNIVDLYLQKTHALGGSLKYDFNDPEAPTMDSLESTKTQMKPIELTWANDIWFSHDDEKFHTSKGFVLRGANLLDEVFKAHCDTARCWRRILRTVVLEPKKILQRIIEFLISILKFLLTKGFGRQLEDKQGIKNYFEGYEKENFQAMPKGEDAINVFNYKISIQMAVFSAITLVLAYCYKYKFGIKNGFLNAIASNDKIYPVCVFLILWLLDNALPWMLFWVLNRLISFRIFLILLNPPVLSFFWKV